MNAQLDVPASTSAEISSSRDTGALCLSALIESSAQSKLMRMFRDPSLLDQQDRTELIAQLRDAVSIEPRVSELRVLLGMALCVNFEAQAALEELRESVRLAPESFVARLKFGELLMRLRICSQAAEETRMAAELASNSLQSDLARRQAATIRTMQREGIERGGYGKLLSVFSRAHRFFVRGEQGRRSVALDTRC